MSSLSPEARARLMAFRRAESPDPEVAERCLAAVERRVAAAPEVTGPSRRVIVGAALVGVSVVPGAGPDVDEADAAVSLAVTPGRSPRSLGGSVQAPASRRVDARRIVGGTPTRWPRRRRSVTARALRYRRTPGPRGPPAGVRRAMASPARVAQGRRASAAPLKRRAPSAPAAAPPR